MKICKWFEDRCQHGYWVDEAGVKFDPVQKKHLCPKGFAAAMREEGKV